MATLERFLEVVQTMPNEVSCALFPQNITNLVQHHFNGSASALARFVRVNRNTVTSWCSGEQRPAPHSLLKLTYCFGGEVLEWLTRSILPTNVRNVRPIPQSVVGSVSRPLRRHSPETVRAHLQSAIRTAENPPPSLTAVCKQLHVNQSTAKRMFPDLAGEIMSRYRLFRTESKRAREEFRDNAVESAVNQLLAEGHPLTYKPFCSLLPPGISTQDTHVRILFKRLRKEAEENMQAVMLKSAVSSKCIGAQP